MKSYIPYTTVAVTNNISSTQSIISLHEKEERWHWRLVVISNTMHICTNDMKIWKTHNEEKVKFVLLVIFHLMRIHKLHWSVCFQFYSSWLEKMVKKWEIHPSNKVRKNVIEVFFFGAIHTPHSHKQTHHTHKHTHTHMLTELNMLV